MCCKKSTTDRTGTTVTGIFQKPVLRLHLRHWALRSIRRSAAPEQAVLPVLPVHPVGVRAAAAVVIPVAAEVAAAVGGGNTFVYIIQNFQK